VGVYDLNQGRPYHDGHELPRPLHVDASYLPMLLQVHKTTIHAYRDLEELTNFPR